MRGSRAFVRIKCCVHVQFRLHNPHMYRTASLSICICRKFENCAPSPFHQALLRTAMHHESSVSASADTRLVMGMNRTPNRILRALSTDAMYGGYPFMEGENGM